MTATRANTLDVTASRDSVIYRGCSFCVLEIEQAHAVLGASIKTLRENFDEQKAVNVKLAAENVAKVSGQIGALSNSVATTFTTHLNRRPRP